MSSLRVTEGGRTGLTWGCGRKVFISFGGLLLFMQGPYKRLTPLRIDYVYLLLKK